MTAAVHPERGAVFDLSARTKLRVSGADCLRYLNGQVSNDVRKATEAAAIHACVLTAKGKISGDVYIHLEGDAFLIDSDPDAREQLAARLERYVIADDVQIEDVSDDFALLHLLGPNSRELAGKARIVAANRYGFEGIDVWIPHAEHEASVQELAQRVPFCDAQCEETFRIERGIPRWQRELTEEIIPNEANLETSAIDYAKGCYIGQEVISRIKMSGQTNKQLCGFITNSETPVESGMRVLADSRDVGFITSATRSERVGAQIALGFVKRGYQTPGSQLIALTTGQATSVAVQIVALPFI